ncbi:hypothetical protein C5C07_11800 [Haloferax sp. Atlit-4N]|uniref:Uncharacterized protein n=1 Tax=Haloferax gibbonsii (strain ATCC 33959 / DSM 4427 / JCM 8863 / NBRC 102184 / NCIMB 2188 / Ma 2.38) TaxID=1227459 RepID=M0H869_HALGM|nr:hypothetical protein C454_10536 [Haloferax gibbonsii ATCC 33959]RDZ52457.1 hypothetical protein C5C07_11800 [Haloferax sp. Atlit-4N]
MDTSVLQLAHSASATASFGTDVPHRGHRERVREYSVYGAIREFSLDSLIHDQIGHEYKKFWILRV